MNFFAVDIGASSGRTIIGRLENGTLKIEELTRFGNPLIEVNGHYYWNLFSLYEAILEGLRKTVKNGIKISSIGIDTWGVDFIAIDKNKEIIGIPYSYRDPHTLETPDKFFERISRRDVYEATGIQIMNFNSLFQLFTLANNDSTMLKNTDKLIFMPDALSYLLTGEVVMEYTIASTSQMLNPYTKEIDDRLLSEVGLSRDKFGEFVMPGTVIGNLSESICRQTGIEAVPVVAVAGHDTASAVAAVPSDDECFAYLSSGTWSLMGVELKEPVVTEETYLQNFTNEGGVDGTIRFLKNICGMWLLEQCRKEWDETLTYPDLIELASTCEPFRFLINPDADVFANSTQMTKSIDDYCRRTNQPKPQSIGEYVRCIFESLALRYREVMEILQKLTPFEIKKLHVIGGGSRNNLLNQFTANALAIPVVTGPSEATAIGNIMLQAKALGIANSLSEIRKVVKNSVELQEFIPQDRHIWEKAYEKYLQVNDIK